jgi:hypothetical protein
MNRCWVSQAQPNLRIAVFMLCCGPSHKGLSINNNHIKQVVNMPNRTDSLTLLLSILLSLALPGTVFCQPETSPDRYELAWSGSDGLRHEIFTSSFAEGIWSEPVKITDNNANNLHPVIDLGKDGTKWIFWSAVRPDGISIEYAVYRDESWSEVTKMNFEQESAITPSILIDRDNVVWLVWAGNSGNLDEIYYSRFLNGAWTAEKIVNQANAVPDIKPVIAWNEQGEIEVRWQGFREGRYTALYSVFTKKGWSAEEEISQKEQDMIESEILENQEIQLPSFVGEESQYFLKVL